MKPSHRSKSPSQDHHKGRWWYTPLKVVEAVLLVMAGLISLLVLAGWCWPLRTDKLTVTANHIEDYIVARQAANEYIRADRADTALNPDCYPIVLDHGRKTEKVLVISHGYTSCPRQFSDIAQQFYDRGYNVIITRLPQHGYEDLMTDELKYLDAEDMLTKTNRAVDIAHGFGEEVDLMGLSMGGPVMAWIGHNRADIHNTVAIDPMFSIRGIPEVLHRPTTGLLDMLPNVFLWWDSSVKENLPGPGYTYPRFGTTGIGQAMRFSVALEEVIAKSPAKSQTMTIITNGNDVTVDNVLTNRLVEQWRQSSSQVVSYEFPKNEKLNHDVIDPYHDDANIELSYPRIIELTDLVL